MLIIDSFKKILMKCYKHNNHFVKNIWHQKYYVAFVVWIFVIIHPFKNICVQTELLSDFHLDAAVSTCVSYSHGLGLMHF